MFHGQSSTGHGAGWFNSSVVGACLLMWLTAAPAAWGQFRDLVDRVPRTANAVLILNMDKVKGSAMGQREGWAKKFEEAFVAGLSRVPPQATRYILAADIDFELMQPSWEVAIVDLDVPQSVQAFVKVRGGVADTIEELPAAALRNNVYLIQFGPTTIGGMGPANRQAVVRWIRQVQDPQRPPLSPYLQQAAGYSDDAGTDIILAIDLTGVYAWEAVAAYVKGKEPMLKAAGSDVRTVTNLLASVQGLRMGVRIADSANGSLVVDFTQPVTIPAPLAKQLLLGALSDAGMKIGDIGNWEAKVKDHTVSLVGYLSLPGLRRISSLIDSPAPSESQAELTRPDAPKADPVEAQVAATLQHYRAVQTLFTDLKHEMDDLNNLNQSAVWFDKYAKKIENMPILNVDEEMLAYSAYVARQLRNASAAVRTMGIRGGMRQSQITGGSTLPYNVSAYGYGSYGPFSGYAGFGATASYDPMADVRGTTAARRVVANEEKGIMANDVRTIQDQLNQATADIRRKMTLKYKVEFK